MFKLIIGTLKFLFNFREDNPKDVTLVVNNQKLRAHKNVLASNSDYFDRMFTSSFKERDQDKIEINIIDVSFETLKTLIGYFYSSVLIITEHNVQVIFFILYLS